MTKEKLIKKYRDCNVDGYDWWDHVYENFKTDLAEEGFEVEDIHFDGFYHQGSYADFTGVVRQVHLFMQKNKMDEKYPATYKLAVEGGIRIYKSEGGRQRASCVDVEVNDWQYYLSHDMDEEMRAYYIGLYQEDTDKEFSSFEQCVKDALYEHAKDLYRTLMQEYEYLCSDEAVWETIQSNEWDKEVA